MSTLSGGQVSIGVKPDAKGFGAAVASAVEGESGTFAGLGKKIGGLLVAGVAAVGVGEAVKKVFETGWDEAKDASAGAAQLAAGIKSTGNAANVSVDSMENLASSIQGMSGQTDDSIVKAEQLLLTFTNIKNVGPNKIFDQATQAAADMAAKMGGDASANAVLLGKALNDPVKGVTALTRVGVSFTQAQKDSIAAMVKSGDTMGAQKLILGELQTEFGGAAKAAGESLPGMIERGKRAFEDLSQSIVEGLLPVIQPVIGALVDGMQAAGPVIGDFVGNVSGKISALVGILQTGNFSAAFRKAFNVEEDSPVVGVLLRVRDSITGTTALLARGDFTKAFRQAFNVEEDSPVVGKILAIRTQVLDLGSAVGPALAKFGASFKPALSAVGDAFAGLWPTIQPLIPGVASLVVAFSPLHAILIALGPSLPQLVQSFGLLAAAVAGTFAGALTTALPALTSLASILSNTLVVTIRALLPLIVGMTNFLSDNAYIIGAVLAGWLAWRVVTGIIDAVKAAQIGMAAASYGLAGASYASTAAQKVAYVTMLLLNGTLKAHMLALFDDGVAATRNAAAQVAAAAQSVGAWIGAKVAAVGAAAETAAAWVAGNARIVAGVVVSTAAWVANTAAQVAAKAVVLGGAVAMGVATAAQWAWNVAMDANPIGLIILAIAALVAAIIWVATQTNIFQTIWRVSVQAIGTAAGWLWNSAVKPAIDGIVGGFNWASSVIGGVINFIGGGIRSVGDAVRNVFSGIGDFIGGAFQKAVGLVKGPVNTIIGFINQAIDGANAVGGAFGVHIGHIPMLAKGGTITAAGQVIVGDRGPELLTLPRGATVDPNIRNAAGSGGAARPVEITQNIEVRDEDSRVVARKFGRELVTAMSGVATA